MMRRHSVRTLGIRFTIPAERGTQAYERARAKKAALYEAINLYALRFVEVNDEP